jgi:hypothetical protein
MNSGKTLFAQLLDFLPWTRFGQIVARYGNDRSGADAVVRGVVPGHGF